MADTKISAAADAGTLLATDMLPLARSGSATAYHATMTEIGVFTNTNLPVGSSSTAGIVKVDGTTILSVSGVLSTASSLLPSSAPPYMDGTANAGTSTAWSRGDHVHPYDTTRAPLASPAFTGTPTAPTVTPATDSSTKLATTAFVQSAVVASSGIGEAPTDGQQYGRQSSAWTVVATPPAPATVAPLMNGTAAVGTSTLYARQDHVHGTDTTRAPLVNPTFTAGLFEHQAAVAASNIDLNAASVFSRTISGATTFTVSNVPASGNVASFVLDLTNGGAGTVTWWSGVKWPGGTAPTLTGTGRDVLGFLTYDGGTTWSGFMLGKGMA